MSPDEVIDMFRESGALLEGHFVYASGRHGSQFIQAARVLMYPEKLAGICAAPPEPFKASAQKPRPRGAAGAGRFGCSATDPGGTARGTGSVDAGPTARVETAWANDAQAPSLWIRLPGDDDGGNRRGDPAARVERPCFGGGGARSV